MREHILARLFQWITHEVIVKGLANSTTFQRLALRTHGSLRGWAERARLHAAQGDGGLERLAPELRARTESWAQWLREFRQGVAEAVRKGRDGGRFG
ncbi:hypothetical protein CDCA_CDCA07G2179 [Cyanidium caldarium]|uniref:Uncharacterized protein n=1 Tax=Cyanidium caldarium TaxID=2771 RepID=A0AAV9IV57_CYACA|nr:hypothetical protein CDCA_CDCA07G2179 [Cyanidium caldarium]